MNTNDKMNVLWICTDSQRIDTLGCYGNSLVRSPNVDRLASEGMLFENTFAQSPLCTPSRGCFLTGRYPVTNRLTKNGQNILPTEKLATKVFADGGYRCGLSGKLHLHACDTRLADFGPEWWGVPGFKPRQFLEPRIDDGYTEFFWDHAPNNNPYSDYTKWVRERGGTIAFPPRSDCRWVEKGMPDHLHQTTFCTDKAIEFIHQHADKPWLFSLNCFAPHYSFNPPEEYLAPYLDRLEEIPLPDYREGELQTKAPYLAKCSNNGHYKFSEMAPRDHRLIRAAYWAMCDHVDYHVGRLLEALEKSGQRERTLVVFMSDHGEGLGDRGLYLKGPFLYDSSIQVPLIVSCPGTIPAGVRRKALVELGDLAPTLVDSAGLLRPAGMQARSFWNLLTDAGAADRFRDDVYSEYYNANPDNPPQSLTMLRTDRYKLIANHRESPSELYDLQQDPGEHENLWNNPAHSKIQNELYQQLCARMADCADPLPPRVGIY